jgi:arginine:ornithine antiporter/lysine permease
MIWSGAFNLPKDMAAGGSGAVIIAWLITGVGMIALGLVFQNLSLRKSELAGGIYSYARAGFGPFIGFNSAWGYWIATILGNVAFVTLLFNSLGYFFPEWKQHQQLAILIGGTVMIWLYHTLILRGVREASLVNILTVIGKLMPIFVFIVFMLFAFRNGIFFRDFWGAPSFSLSGVMKQVKNTMLVTLWAFVGVEGAVVLSGKAKRMQDVGKATVTGLIGTLVVYMLISLLSLGVMPKEKLANLPEPAMAYVLKEVVGPWGATLINLGLAVSIMGAMLSWTMLAIEIPYVAARDGMFPASFARENKNRSPVMSLWWTSGITQLFVVVVYFSKSTYQMVYSMASVAVLFPYLLSALYQLKMIRTKETYEDNRAVRKDRVIGWIATLYSVWLLYAAGLDYLLMVSVLYLAGFILYIWVQRARGNKLFQGGDWLLAGAVGAAGVVAVALMLTGQLTP